MKKEKILEIELRGDQLYAISKNGLQSTIEMNITPVWHFFKQVNDFMKSPVGMSLPIDL